MQKKWLTTIFFDVNGVVKGLFKVYLLYLLKSFSANCVVSYFVKVGIKRLQPLSYLKEGINHRKETIMITQLTKFWSLQLQTYTDFYTSCNIVFFNKTTELPSSLHANYLQ